MYMTNKISFFAIVCIFVKCTAQQDDISSTFNDTSLNFIKVVQNKLCGTVSQCNRNLNFDDTRSIEIYQTYKSVLPMTVPPDSDPYCCSSCSCDLSTCRGYGTCCSDILSPEIVNNDLYKRFTCTSAQLRPRKIGIQNGKSVWMVRKCLKGNNVNVTKDKCENWARYQGLDTRVPVTDKTTNITYFNRHCFECNNIHISRALEWNARLVCSTEDEGASLQNIAGDGIVEAIIQTKSESCNIVYELPEGSSLSLFNCYPTISECNVTGLWENYDPFIEAACLMYTSVYMPNWSYKNLFCYMCNEVVIRTVYFRYRLIIDEIPLFSFLLKYRADDTQGTYTESIDKFNCSAIQIYDKIKKMCRNISCRFPKTLEGGRCENMVEMIAGVNYIMYMKLTTLNTTTEAQLDDIIGPLLTFINEKLTYWEIKSFVHSFDMLYIMKYTEKHRKNMSETGMETNNEPIYTPPSTTVEDTSFPARDLKEEEEERSKFENNMNFLFLESTTTVAEVFIPTLLEMPISKSNNTISYILFRIGFYVNAKRDQLNISVIDDILKMDGDNVTLTNITGNVNGHFKVSLEDFSNTDFTAGKVVNMTDIEEDGTLKVIPLTNLLTAGLNKKIEPFVIAEKLFCPLVYLDAKHDKEITTSNASNSILLYGRRIDRKYFYNDHDKSYYICSEAFLQAVNNAEKSENKTLNKSAKMEPTKRIISITMTMVSVLCSLLTFMTYCVLKELRTQPGLNNMCLVLNLIIAQLLFQFGIGQTRVIPHWACQTIGVLVHFFWLMVIFWMNVCSIHMFNVFGSIRKVKSKHETSHFKTTLMYAIYCFLSSAICVAINIIVESVSSHNESIGYGGQLCYISKRKMVGYTFALPIFLVIITNVALFGIVVIKIIRMPTVASNMKSNRNYLKIYAKLSSLTGITWLTGLLIYFTDNEIFEYIFIILNSGQGLFIFLSFVCNKRVVELYKTLLVGQKTAQPSSTSETMNESIH